jgi:AraC-like DNA-binding protein
MMIQNWPDGYRHMTTLEKQEGFRGQIQYVIPRPILINAARHILVSGLYPTDIGFYPAANHHLRQRDSGAEEHILIFCRQGQGWFELQGNRHLLKAGQALVIPRHTPHAYGASPQSPWTIHWMHFLGEEATYYLTLLQPEHPLLNVDPGLTAKVEWLFADASEALSNGFSPASLICAAQAARHILSLLFFSNRAFVPGAADARQYGLETVIQFMKEHVNEALPLPAMAARAGISVTHFSRLFRQQTGFSPMDYFIHLKIQRACRYLTLSQLSIKEISAQIGYEDPYYFSRIFRKVMGLPPAEYRKVKLG